MAYTSVSKVKSYLGITGSGDDDLLQTFIDSAAKFIESWTGRKFGVQADTTRTFDAIDDVDASMLWFDEDLCAITSVTNGDSIVVASNEYTTQPRNETPYYALRILTSSGKSWTYTEDHQDAISIVGRWGYSTDVPADVELACIRLAAYLYRQKDNAGDLDRGIVAGNATILPASLPADIRTLLDPYRKLR